MHAKAIVRAGVDIIAHGVRDKPVDAEFIDMMKARSVWYIATIVLDETTFVFAEQPPRGGLHARGRDASSRASLAWRRHSSRRRITSKRRLGSGYFN
jgi:hypothetical protein